MIHLINYQGMCCPFFTKPKKEKPNHLQTFLQRREQFKRTNSYTGLPKSAKKGVTGKKAAKTL